MAGRDVCYNFVSFMWKGQESFDQQIGALNYQRLKTPVSVSIVSSVYAIAMTSIQTLERTTLSLQLMGHGAHGVNPSLIAVPQFLSFVPQYIFLIFSYQSFTFDYCKDLVLGCLSSSFIPCCFSANNRINPLNRVQSSADVQAVTVHFIIIGSSHLRERERHEGDEGRGRDRQIGEMRGVRQERTNRGREGWMSRETSLCAGEQGTGHTQREGSLQPTF